MGTFKEAQQPPCPRAQEAVPVPAQVYSPDCTGGGPPVNGKARLEPAG